MASDKDSFQGESFNYPSSGKSRREHAAPTPTPRTTTARQSTEGRAVAQPDSKKMTLWIAAGAVALAACGLWWTTTPHSFEECVQKNLKNAHTTASVTAIHRTCQSQHK